MKRTVGTAIAWSALGAAAFGRRSSGELEAWLVNLGGPCYADCNGDSDFICFQSAFAAGAAQADCDHNSQLNVNDFVCFQTEFAVGCP